MSADLARWPRLKLETHPVLDWVEIEYRAAMLEEMADAVGKNPNPIQTRAPGGLLGVWDPAIEKVLRALAGSKAAISALNHRRPTPPARVVGFNRAVHVRVLAELLPQRKAAAVWADVAEAWGCSAGHVKDDVGEFDDAERLVQAIVVSTCNARTRAGEPRSTRGDVLEDFDNDMRGRGVTDRRRKK